jgi:inner membrane protease subunit 1
MSFSRKRGEKFGSKRRFHLSASSLIVCSHDDASDKVTEGWKGCCSGRTGALNFPFRRCRLLTPPPPAGSLRCAPLQRAHCRDPTRTNPPTPSVLSAAADRFSSQCIGASMYPTLSHTGTFVLHSALSLRLSPLERGNLVTAVSPLDPAHQVLKRVIGLPGDNICVDPSGERKKKEEWCRVPKGHVWLCVFVPHSVVVMWKSWLTVFSANRAGDNTSNSTDSRDYGPVPLALVRGKIVARVRYLPSLPPYLLLFSRRPFLRIHPVSSISSR